MKIKDKEEIVEIKEKEEKKDANVITVKVAFKGKVRISENGKNRVLRYGEVYSVVEANVKDALAKKYLEIVKIK